MSKKKQGMVNRIVTGLLWIAALYLLFFGSFWYLAAALLALHTVELLVVGYRKGTSAGYSGAMTVAMVLVFGYTWWLYLEPGEARRA
jgi:hypothetical protein